MVEQTTRSSHAVDYDAILDEIDSVLESDAEEYVRSFVQKGGQ
ncbi:MAG TPA: ubiquitin-like protein Pup [Propionicimonas sp.]|nr:ubiquitin-like protein Pup [Propionicimonas sp.]